MTTLAKTEREHGIFYHFTGATLRNGEPIPPKGRWLKHKGHVVPCQSGLHASSTPFDALQYAPGEMLHQVKLRGTIIPHGDPVDKFAATERKIIATIDCTPILRLFARRVALDVIHLWDAPQIGREYLKTGDESKRDAALAAAWAAERAAERAAAWDAVRDAAWAAARAAERAAAWAAARAAAWAAARAAERAAAWAAAWDAVRDAAWASWAAARDAAQDVVWAEKQKLYRGWFNEMVEAEFSMRKGKK